YRGGAGTPQAISSTLSPDSSNPPSVRSRTRGGPAMTGEGTFSYRQHAPMNFLDGLHGAVALALLCGLLFAEEAGVPLPFAPGELNLMAAGLLIATGALNPFVYFPLALVACVAGSLV